MAHPLTPVPTPETQPYWDGIAAQTLRLPRCLQCSNAFFPPTPICPNCSAQDLEWFDASGRATLYSYVIHHRPLAEWGTDGPRSVAIVELDEGPRIISSVVGCEQTPEALVLDMPLQAVFVPFDDIVVLAFEPVATGGAVTS